MRKIIEGNLLDIDEGIICQQVNCQGIMGSGLAKQIREKYPQIYDRYKRKCNAWSLERDSLLGQVQLLETELNSGLWIANVFGQYDYGRDGRRYTNYGAVAEGFTKLAKHSDYRTKIYVPYKMGCDLGGGDWDVYSEIIEHFVPNAIVVRLA